VVYTVSNMSKKWGGKNIMLFGPLYSLWWSNAYVLALWRVYQYLTFSTP
jgi:hypothetical protein